MSKTSRIFSHDEEPAGEPERYRSLVEVGRGGMAVVYRAWDSHMDRDVALKVAREEVADNLEVRRRFGEESRIAGTLTHPSILPVYDRGVHKGRPYLAMQFVDGVSLDHAKLPLREAIACLATAAEAVHHAHQQGVIHRDLKPSNILLGRDGRVYLTDFGVARQTVTDFRRTATGLVVGTPAYMSPEQARAEDVDARSDVYSLGATLYELAVGRPPYEGVDPQAVLEALRSRPPVAPRKANPEVSRNVEAIIRMAMERLPQDRYATAQALAEDLKLYQNRRRPLARARGFRYYVGRELVRHPVRTAARTISMLLLIGAVVFGGLLGSACLTYRKALQESDPLARIALLEKAADFWPSARRKLKEDIDALAAGKAEEQKAETRRIQEIYDLERQVQEALDQRIPQAADKHLQGLRERHAASYAKLLQRRNTLATTLANQQLLADIGRKLAAGDLDAAEAGARKLPEEHPERAAILEEVRAARFKSAVRSLEKAAGEGDPAAFELLFTTLAGPAHAAEKDRNRTLAPPARTLGLLLAKRADRRGAVIWLDAAEARGGADAELHRIRGLLHLEESRWNEAERDLKRFRQLSPGDPPNPPEFWRLFHQRAREAASSADWSGAQDLLNVALRHSKEPAVLWHDLGLARWNTVREPELVLADLDEALRRDPTLKPDPAYRAVVRTLAQRRLDEALEVDDPAGRKAIWTELLRRVEGIGAAGEEFRRLRAGMLRRLGRFDEARRELEPTGTSTPLRLDAAQVRVAEAALAADPKENLGEAYALLEAAGDGPEIRLWRGLIGARLAHPAALQDLQAAGELFPTARLELARLLHARKQLRPSLQQLDLALVGIERPGHDDYLWLGAEPRAASLSEARSAWRRDTLILRARVRYDAEFFSGCVDDCTLLLKPAVSPELLLLRGLAHRVTNPPAWLSASEDLEAYLKLRPQDVNARLAAAGAAYELKRYQVVEDHCSAIIDAGTKAPEPYYLRGLARKPLGHINGANRDFDAAFERCPAGSPLRPKIELERRAP